MGRAPQDDENPGSKSYRGLRVINLMTPLGSEPPPERRKPRQQKLPGFSNYKPGDDLLSHRVTPAVPSALEILTSVFEMGTGGVSPLLSPSNS